MVNITIANLFLIIINIFICIKLNTTQTVILDNWVAYDWKISLSILTFAISIPTYYYMGLTHTGYLLKIISLPINLMIFFILAYIFYLDNNAFSSEILVISGIDLTLIKNEWTYEQKNRIFTEFQKGIEYIFSSTERDILVRIAVSPTDLNERMLKKALENSQKNWLDIFYQIEKMGE